MSSWHMAFKCAYNDNTGLAGHKVVGYMGPCSKPTTVYNVKKGAPWCSLPECPCNGYVYRGEERGVSPCYECRMLVEWKAYAGFDHDAADSWTPRRIIGTKPGRIAFLTTRYPGTGESERFIFAAFVIGEVMPYDPEKSGWVRAEDELRVALAPEELIYFWNHYRNRNKPDYLGWGSGRFRYLDAIQAASAMKAMAEAIKDEDRKIIASHIAEFSLRD